MFRNNGGDSVKSESGWKVRVYTQQKSKANQSSVFKPLSTNNWF